MRDKINLNVEPSFQESYDSSGIASFKYKTLTTKKVKYLFYVKKYFILISDCDEIGKINNFAIDLAISGKLDQARILFNSILDEKKDIATVLNNLAVVNELDKNYSFACKNYKEAIKIDGQNKIILENFITFIESGKNNVKR